MKQLLILSGKGGTGKTTLASAFIKLSRARAFADCDVDAPNLHLVSGQLATPQRKDFFGLPKAEIEQALCVQCGICQDHCRFGAIGNKDGRRQVNPFACEGCGVCRFVCPQQAIALNPAVAGDLVLYKNHTVFSTAQLKMGSGTSGLLVTEVKRQLLQAAGAAELAIIDGSPGIGCPVIASLSGVDMVLIVAEPSVSGISDMKRILQTAAHFQIPAAVCINKADTNRDNSGNIIAFCRENNLPFAGQVPFDPLAVKAVNNGQTIVDLDCPAGRAAKAVFAKTMEILERGDETLGY